MSAETRPRVLLVARRFIKRKEDGKLLIIRRSPTDSNNANLWEIAGGKVEEGQDINTAGEDEVRQETGLLSHVTFPVATIVEKIIADGKYAGMPYLAVFHISELVGGEFALSDEHSDHAWVTYEQMLKYKLTFEVWKAAIVLRKHLE